jgi:hypothetical protein
MKLSRIVIVGLVVGMLVLGYFAFVGVSEPVEDVNDPGDDPTGGERTPTAYGIIHVTIEVDNAVARYTGSINDAYVTVYDYISFDEGKVYQNQKYDLMGIFSDNMIAWVMVDITGPGQFQWPWESDHSEFSLSEWGHKTLTFTSGRCYFWDKGDYSLSIKAYADGDSGKYEVDTQIKNFSVGV